MKGWGRKGETSWPLGHGGPRRHPGRNEEEAAQNRLAVQVRNQDWQHPCQSHQHRGKATRTRLKQDRGDQDWVPETVGRMRFDKRVEQELGGKEWWSVLRSNSGDGGVFEMCLGCGNQSGQQGRKEAEEMGQRDGGRTVVLQDPGKGFGPAKLPLTRVQLVGITLDTIEGMEDAGLALRSAVRAAMDASSLEGQRNKLLPQCRGS